MSFDPVSGRLEGDWSDRKRWSVAGGLLAGVSFMHSIGVVHRDIKERNWKLILGKDGEWTVVFLDLAGAYVDEAALEKHAGLGKGALQSQWESLVLTHMHPDDTKHLPRSKEAGQPSAWPGGAGKQGQRMQLAVGKPGVAAQVPPLNAYERSGLGVVGGLGSEMRRGRVPNMTFRDAKLTMRKWELFDRMALAIQLLMLAMSEDFTRRMGPIGSVVEMPELAVESGALKRKKGARKERQPVEVWLEDHFWSWLDDPSARGGSQSVPAAWRGQRHLQRGLAGAWERTDGKVLDRSGKTVAVESWDTSALCAQAIGGLMAAKTHANTSKEVLDASRELLRRAWPA